MTDTPVGWLADEIILLEERLRQGEINLNDFMDLKDNLVTQALEMESQKLTQAIRLGSGSLGVWTPELEAAIRKEYETKDN